MQLNQSGFAAKSYQWRSIRCH